jgi:hypothetical protein
MEHARAAQEAAIESEEAGPEGLKARKRALQEASKALSLDPSNKDATEVLVSLMLNPPVGLPQEVRASVRERHDRLTRSAFLRLAIILAAGLLPMTIGMLVMTNLSVGDIAILSSAGLGVVLVHLILYLGKKTMHWRILFGFLSFQALFFVVIPFVGMRSPFPSMIQAAVISAYLEATRVSRGLTAAILSIGFTLTGLAWLFELLHLWPSPRLDASAWSLAGGTLTILVVVALRAKVTQTAVHRHLVEIEMVDWQLRQVLPTVEEGTERRIRVESRRRARQRRMREAIAKVCK